MHKGSIGLFIPTIFGRPDYILETVRSILDGLPGSRKVEHFILVEKKLVQKIPKAIEHQRIVTIDTDGILPLPEKVGFGLELLAEASDYQCWIGDDDLLDPEWLENACDYLDQNPDIQMVYGDCNYIGPDDEHLFKSTPGQIAERILGWGPDLIPQPSSVWRSSIYKASGGINKNLSQAFDYDLFLKFARMGKIRYLPITGSSFRWHPDSLSVKNRAKSAFEAVRVRWNNASPLLKPLHLFTEPVVFSLTWLAGKLSTTVARLKTLK